MKPEEFAYYLACWMSPGVLAQAAKDWGEVPGGHEIIELQLGSPILTSASEARFDWFIRQFLDHVNIPEELIRYTSGTYPKEVTPGAADWLRNFKFTGDVKFAPDRLSPVPDGHVLAVIFAPLCQVRVLWSPLHMLNELVSVKAAYWRRVAEVSQPDQVHHEVRGEWPFEVWIDLQVARACGFPAIGRAGMIPPNNTIKNVRGHVSIVGRLPRNAEELSLFAFAAGLHPKTQSREFDLDEAIKGL